MKAELKRYQTCPQCGKDMRDHDLSIFAGAEEREKAEIHLHRELYEGLPKETFKTWLIEKRKYFTNEVLKLWKDIDSPLVQINSVHDALMILNVWYNYIDIYDTEIQNSKTHFKTAKEESKFIINHIDIKKLVKVLEQKQYFDSSYFEVVLSWFNGIAPDDPIPMNCSANYFISIIADLCDASPAFIKNSKKFCYTYISKSFLFKGSKPEISYIEKVMKPGKDGNRVSCTDKTIPDIQLYNTYR